MLAARSRASGKEQVVARFNMNGSSLTNAKQAGLARSAQGKRHRPYFWRRGDRRIPFPLAQGLGEFPRKKCEGDGAPPGAPRLSAFARRKRALRSARSNCGDFCPRRRTSRRRTELFTPLIRAASTALRSRHVQPLKAAGHNAGGRLAGASRVRVANPARGRRTAALAGRTRQIGPGQDERRISSAALPGCSTSGSPLEAPLMSRQWEYTPK